MEVVIFLAVGYFMPFELVPDRQLTPDDEEVYEQVEDSLIKIERFTTKAPSRSHLLIRFRVDSIRKGIAEPGNFIRLNLSKKNQEACIIIEKDVGEKQIADFWGGGFSFKRGEWRFTFGDFLLHFGRGLIFSTPSARSGFSEVGFGQKENVLARSAQENRNLRGLRIDRTFQRFTFTCLGSYSPRDATLNADGTIARLKFCGVHRDSVSLKEKGQAAQMLVGLIAQIRGNERVSAGLAVQGIRFNRPFAPDDSAYSFYGQNLGALSLFLKAGAGGRSGGLELATSLPDAIAVSAVVAVKEAGMNAVLGGSVYSARFFSPAGRAYGLSRRFSRAEVNAHFGYHQGGFSAAVEGNTRRDYLTDSIPARLQFRTGYESKPLQLRFILGERFRAEDEQSRSARIEIETGWRIVMMRLAFGDEYPLNSVGRGRIAELNIRTEASPVDISLTGVLIDITGKGIRVYASESGVMRVGTGFTSGESAQRLSITAAVKIKELGRLGAKLGFTHKDDWQPDFAMQVEVIN